jgi:hypothetical protein
LACCAYQKYEGLLLDPQVVAPYFMVFLDPTDPGDVLLMDARKQNGLVYILLSLSNSTSDTVTFNAVQNAESTELSSGDAKHAWKNICEINQPATKVDQHDLEQQFYYKLKHKSR